MEALVDECPDWDGHLLLVHRTEEERRCGVAAWVEHGLRRQAKIIYFQPRDLDADRTLEGILESHPVQRGREAIAEGQLQVVEPGPDVYSAEGQRHLLELALAEGFTSLRLSGEADRSRAAVSPEVHDAAEVTVDRLCRTEPVSALCQYSVGLSGDLLGGVYATHAGGLLPAGVHVRATTDAIRLAGEADLTSAEALQLWLRTALRDEQNGSRVLDLSRLAFLDVAGYRSILEGSADLRAGGGRVLVRGAHGVVLRLLSVIGAENDPGVEVEA